MDTSSRHWCSTVWVDKKNITTLLSFVLVIFVTIRVQGLICYFLMKLRQWFSAFFQKQNQQALKFVVIHRQNRKSHTAHCLGTTDELHSTLINKGFIKSFTDIPLDKSLHYRIGSSKLSRIQSISQKPKQISKQLWREDSWRSTFYKSRHLCKNSSSRERERIYGQKKILL